VEILEKLRHPNIVAFYGAVTSHSNHMCIVQELCAGSVYDHLQKFGKLVDDNNTLKLGLLTRIRFAYGLSSYF
jgi:serine/threonine protein kinase